jgi:hypothetical protein
VKRLAILLVLLAAGCGDDASDLGSEPDLAEPAAMMLRLSDLPAGFRYGDDRGCGDAWTTEGDDPELDEFLLDAGPRSCIGDFSREWGGEPRAVQTALLIFDSEDDARHAWEVRQTLFENVAGIRITDELGGPGHGAEGQAAFDSKGINFPGAGEAWRDGRIVVVVYQEGLDGDEGRDFAADLAEKQRSRIESPSDPRREDDREIGLEDPAIAIPVYWLGREFAPEGLPELELYRGDHIRGKDAGQEVKIDYDTKGSSVTLDLWKPEAWRQFTTTRLGRLFWSSPCARRTEFEVAGGRAELYGAYAGACRGEPNRWLAHVYFDEVVVAVNMAYGEAAADAPGRGRYNSHEGMEAVVRGLRRR